MKEKCRREYAADKHLQIRLALSDEVQAVQVAKGGFYQQTGGNWIFKVAENGKTAYKVDIQLGRQNPDYYEVLEGLETGRQSGHIQL